MKGLMKAVLLCTAGSGAMGCYGYRDLVDPCYPERYEYAARREVREAFTPQVLNGHVLDQTIWNYHFEPGTATLNAGGIDYLARIARTRPQPDPVLFLQTAQDITYDPAAPDKMSTARNELDGKRIESVQKFLQAQTANRPIAFHVQVHDPAEVGMAAVPTINVVQQMYGSYKATLPRGGAGVSGGGGVAAGSGR